MSRRSTTDPQRHEYAVLDSRPASPRESLQKHEALEWSPIARISEDGGVAQEDRQDDRGRCRQSGQARVSQFGRSAERSRNTYNAHASVS
jgi:hypothetical protein